MSEKLAAIVENATIAKNTEPADDSMEKLQIEEEEEKNASNTSANDFLGGKSLLMSDDDSDDEATVPKKISPKRQRVLDSDDEQAEIADDGELQQQQTTTIVKQKISAIIDTDSEDEQVNKQTFDSPTKPLKEQQEDTPKKHKPKKFSKKKALQLNSDSDASDQEQVVNHNDVSSAAQPTLKGLIDSDSEDSNAALSANEEQPVEQTEKPKKAKPMRASAKKAMDEMQAIQSEQQRLHREAQISVPYHQPKPRTLKEFLNRRTINRPLATAMAGGSPMPIKQPRQSLALRMTGEELEAYAKLMEERAKEATEFFKSESEHEDSESDDEEMVFKDNPGVLDKLPIAEEIEMVPEIPQDETVTATTAATTEETLLNTPIETEPVEVSNNEFVIADNPAALTATELLTEPTSPAKPVLVTEIIELPRLDLCALNITPPSKPATPQLSEAIRRLKMEKINDISPSLKGDPNMVIDLETGDMFAKKPSGVDDLLQRLMKTREAKKHKTTETVNILSTEHGKLELSKVSIHLHEEEPINKDQKPGAAFIKVQQQLKALITQKRIDELHKKQAEEMEYSKCLGEIDDELMEIDEDEYEPEDKPSRNKCFDEEENVLNINEEEDLMTSEAEQHDQEETEQNSDIKENEQESENEVAQDSDESNEESVSEPEQEQTNSKRKHRIIRAFQNDNSETDDDDDDMDLLQTPKPPKVAPISATQLQLSAHKLFDEEVQRTASDEENELLGLCSGRFTQAEKMVIETAKPVAIISQMPITQLRPNHEVADELEALCSGSFETQPTQVPLKGNKILSSDEEATAQSLETEKPRTKKLTKKMSKKKVKLGFSDDEESDEEQAVLESDEEISAVAEDEPAEEAAEIFVDYDSEENEIVVQMTKKDRKLHAANFVENEAELSESEWGSADEDEKNMDTYDIELGDDDEFDREKLRSELGQIHARKMLDQDLREVRKIKELLFEDDDGAVRQRQFRWKNAESGFGLEDRNNENAVDGHEGSGDEENEHLWRKIRYEREQLLLENKLKDETIANASPLTPAIKANITVGRKLNIITCKKSTLETKQSSPFLISNNVSSAMQKTKTVRGSFLVRDKETLSKLAGLTKGAGDAEGTAGTVSVTSVKAKNFVFATLTEEEHENQKRKAADLLNSSSETGINFMKKARMEPRRDRCLIDQLL